MKMILQLSELNSSVSCVVCLFSVYLHSSFTASIILDSLLDDLNFTTILTWYQSHFKQASCLSLCIEHQKHLGFHKIPAKSALLPVNLFKVVVRV